MEKSKRVLLEDLPNHYSSQKAVTEEEENPPEQLKISSKWTTKIQRGACNWWCKERTLSLQTVLNFIKSLEISW